MARGNLETYGFNRDETNMLIHAAKRLDVDLLVIAEFTYGASILDHWERSDWSVDNICEQYLATKKVYV